MQDAMSEKEFSKIHTPEIRQCSRIRNKLKCVGIAATWVYKYIIYAFGGYLPFLIEYLNHKPLIICDTLLINTKTSKLEASQFVEIFYQ